MTHLEPHDPAGTPQSPRGTDALPSTLARLCATCVRSTDTLGAGVLLDGAIHHSGRAHATDPVSTCLAQLQLNGDGPHHDTRASGAPVLVPTLDPDGSARWPDFTFEAVGAGVRAVFCFALHTGEGMLGTLTLHRDQPGPLSPRALATATAFADATAILLDQRRLQQHRIEQHLIADGHRPHDGDPVDAVADIKQRIEHARATARQQQQRLRTNQQALQHQLRRLMRTAHGDQPPAC